MKYQARKVFVRLVQVLSFSILFLSLPAWAQFEVAPDHFDPTPSPVKKQTAKTTAGKPQVTAPANVDGKHSPTANSKLAASAVRPKTAGVQTAGNRNPQLAKTSTRKTTARKRVTTGKVALASTR